MNAPVVAVSASRSFQKAARAPKQPATYPFSIRLTPEEKAYLEQKAGHRPIGAYARSVLLEGMGQKRRSYRVPRGDDPRLAAIVDELGRSHLSSNLNQLAKAANMGTLDVTQDVERQLEDAYKAILAMRDALFIALGMPSGVKE